MASPFLSPLDHLADHSCDLCPLGEQTSRPCVMGDGPVDAKAMIIGEAPGENEANTGRVFSGRAGQLLDLKLADAGIPRPTVYVTNVVKCRPPDNDRPSRIEWEACSSYLEAEVREVRPSHVLLLGNTALQAVARKSGITKHRGVRLPVGGAWKDCEVMATIHPAYVLRNPGQDSVLSDDIRRFARMLQGGFRAVEVRSRLVRTTSGLRKLRKILEEAEVITYDVENRYAPWHPEWKLLVLGVTVNGTDAYVVPLNHPESPFEKRWRDVLAYLRPALERKGVKRVGQNAKHDNVQLAGGGVYIRHSFDTMLAAHVLDENRPKNLGFLSQSILGADVYKGMVDTKPEHILKHPLRDLARYNGYDVGYNHQIYFKLREELIAQPRLLRLFSKLLMPASHVIQEVEATGMWVNQKRLWPRIEKVHQLVLQQREVLDEYNPRGDKWKGKRDREFNYNSTQQLGRWLFSAERKGGLGLDPIETTKTGAYSTREAVLLHYRDHPAVRALLKYRTLQLKWLNTYLLPWSEKLDVRSRLHTTYKIYGTVTGRLSGDLQQVPRHTFIRGVFGAPKGWQWIQADFSQIELRIAAHCAQEERMMHAFALGQDLHLLTAQRLTGKNPEEITKEERKKAKAVNFGFLYGMYPKKFQSYAFENYGLKVSLAEAELARERYFEQFPSLLKWHRAQERIVRATGYVSSPIGRVRHLPDVLSSDRGVVAEAVRQAINSPVQGCANDLMLFAMIRLHPQFDPREIFMVGTLHDAIFFQCRDEVVQKWGGIIKETMENLPLKKTFGVELDVPIVSDVEWGQHWGEPVGMIQ